MKLILLGIAMCCTFSVNAQKEKKAISPEKFVTISMSKLPIAEFPENTIEVSNISIIQCVSDSFRMGYTLKGQYSAVATLKFGKPLSDILQTQVNRMYKHEYKKEGVEFLWVIKALRFGSSPGSINYSYTRFHADGYISMGGHVFKKACTIDTVFVILNGGGHSSDIENAFRVLLRKTFAGIGVIEQNVGGQTIAQISRQSIPDLNIPILNANTYDEGVYISFDEFLQNKPFVKQYEQVEGEKKTTTIIFPGSNAKSNIWGLCKNGKIYKYHNGTLIELKKEGNGFIIADYVEVTTWNNRRNAEIGFVVSGIPILFYKKSDKPILVESIPNLNDPKAQPAATCIDMKTGEFSF